MYKGEYLARLTEGPDTLLWDGFMPLKGLGLTTRTRGSAEKDTPHGVSAR
jgi:hypothetical protein